MANSTLLQIVDQVWTELALGGTTPATVISNTDTAVVQLLNLVNGLGNDLVKEHEWQWINKEYRFTTVYYTYTADTTLNSTTIANMSSTTGLTSTPTYFMVTGSGIPQDTYVVSVNGGASTAVLSRAPTATATGASLTFSQVMYAMPSDYDRLVDSTEWDKNNHWRLMGPVRAQGWQWLKSGFIATGPRARFRVLANLFQVWPPLGSANYMGFEYMSNQWVAATGATPSKSTFTVDTDTCVFPDRLMMESLKLRFAKMGGFEWLMKFYSPSELNTGIVSRLLSLAKSQDAGSAVLSLAPRRGSSLISTDNIPDGNWNQ